LKPEVFPGFSFRLSCSPWGRPQYSRFQPLVVSIESLNCCPIVRGRQVRVPHGHLDGKPAAPTVSRLASLSEVVGRCPPTALGSPRCNAGRLPKPPHTSERTCAPSKRNRDCCQQRTISAVPAKGGGRMYNRCDLRSQNGNPCAGTNRHEVGIARVSRDKEHPRVLLPYPEVRFAAR
jgi:hypothetical protein